MTVQDVREIMDAWAPPSIAWEGDNVGLQVGDPAMRVRGILVALDVTEGVIAEAGRRGANLIVSHHPLLFRPLRSLTPASPVARSVTALASRGIALFAAHTNLDFTRGGTSFALAGALGIEGADFLRKPYRLQSKVVTFVPPADADAVARAMSEAGAGIIGEYDQCSFRMEGTGTFRGGAASRPAVGTRGRHERVREVRLEMVAPRQAVPRVVRALVSAHPYEEPAYDIVALENVDRAYGMGVIGELPRRVSLARFLATVRRALGARAPRFAGDPRALVQKIAVCGGSGAALLDDAIASGADVYVTADVKYHAYHEADGRLALVDAGHYETEFPVVGAVAEHLRRAIAARGERAGVRTAARPTNPVRQGLS